MTSLTLWERVKLGSKTGFERSWRSRDRPNSTEKRRSINRLSAEAFWPTTLDKECDKAARILKSFCVDGFYTEEPSRIEHDTNHAQRRLKRIPASVIRDAKALLIFTNVRNGLWLSGAGGSGVLIAQKDDGSWSPPSAILVHTAALGFVSGADVYDCVVVIDTQEALEAFYNVRCSLGTSIPMEAGPIITKGALELPMNKRHAPITTYLKSRGIYSSVQLDGTIVVERGDENDEFYGQTLSTEEVVNGRLHNPPQEIRRLQETIKAAQGDTAYDASALPKGPPPGDFEINNGQVFGLPDKTDPDPYGVLALEKEGMGVVEAGSKQRASWDQFSFNPSPTSPVHSIYARNSTSQGMIFSRRDNWRTSSTSSTSQTFIRPNSLRKSTESRLRLRTHAQTSTTDSSSNEGWSPSILTWRNGLDRQSSRTSTTPSTRPFQIPRDSVMEDDFFDKDATPAPTPYLTPPSTPPSSDLEQSPVNAAISTDADYTEAKHGIQVLGSSSAPIVAKATLVNIPKRIPGRPPSRDAERSTEQDVKVDTSAADLPKANNIITQPQILDPVVAALLASEGKVVHTITPPTHGPAHDASSARPVSKSSSSNGTWDKIRAFRAIDEYD